MSDRKPGDIDEYGDMVINEQWSLHKDHFDGKDWKLVDWYDEGQITTIPTHLADSPRRAAQVADYVAIKYHEAFEAGISTGKNELKTEIRTAAREFLGIEFM